MNHETRFLSLSDPASSVDVVMELTEREREILAIEKQWWQYAGAKEAVVRDRLDVTMTRYCQLLNALIDTDRAMAAEPILVKRLQRIRAARQRSRSLRRPA